MAEEKQSIFTDLTDDKRVGDEEKAGWQPSRDDPSKPPGSGSGLPEKEKEE